MLVHESTIYTVFLLNLTEWVTHALDASISNTDCVDTLFYKKTSMIDADTYKVNNFNVIEIFH